MWVEPPSVIVPLLLIVFAVILSVLPVLAVTVAPALLPNVVGLIVNVPAVALSVPLLVKVVGDRVKVCPAVLAMMLPLLIRLAALLSTTPP